MQTGTKKTPDRFQNYFCPAAANDIVHHAYAWIVKEPNMQPKFLYCRAIDDPANVRGWNIIAEVWERDVLGGWGISSSTIHVKTPPTDMYLPRVCPERQHHCLTRYSERWSMNMTRIT